MNKWEQSLREILGSWQAVDDLKKWLQTGINHFTGDALNSLITINPIKNKNYARIS